MRKKLNGTLYLVTDRELARRRELTSIISAALKGGITALQLREKEISARDFIALALEVKSVLKGTRVPLIINDRADIAKACGADGVHLGQSDIPAACAREILGPNAIIGLSVETPQQAAEAEKMDVDYLGVSAVFATATKDIDTIWGLKGIEALRKKCHKPLIGIGGINGSNAADVIRAGADGVAVVSAICSARDPESAARQLKQTITDARKEYPRAR